MGYSTTCASGICRSNGGASGANHNGSSGGFKTEDGNFKSDMPLINLNGDDLSPIVGRFNFNQQTDSSSLGKLRFFSLHIRFVQYKEGC